MRQIDPGAVIWLHWGAGWFCPPSTFRHLADVMRLDSPRRPVLFQCRILPAFAELKIRSSDCSNFFMSTWAKLSDSFLRRSSSARSSAVGTYFLCRVQPVRLMEAK